jgi:hypothetical protein
MNDFYFFLMIAFGVFIGNWLVSPLIIHSRSFTDGFWIGVIAAALVMVFYFVFRLIGWR